MAGVQYHIQKYASIARLVADASAYADPAVPGRMEYGASSGRRCSVQHIPKTKHSAALFSALEAAFSEINATYGFDISEIGEPLQLISYEVAEHISWHIDGGIGAGERRKISLSLQLTEGDEYAGGDLEFADGTCHPFARTLGAITAFPSLLAHRVTPITAGSRQVLVAWMHGAPFR